jgi:RNA recognition motif-containing protein
MPKEREMDISRENETNTLAKKGHISGRRERSPERKERRKSRSRSRSREIERREGRNEERKSSGRREKEKEGYSVYVGNLDDHIVEDDILKAFSQYGEVFPSFHLLYFFSF